MIADTSALVAILLEEHDAEIYLDAIAQSPTAMSSVSFLEVRIVLARRYATDRTADLAAVVEEAGIDLTASS